MNNEVVHKIGDAVLTEKAIETLESWQKNGNDNLEGWVCDLLKVCGFIARTSEAYSFTENDRKAALRNIITISEMTDELDIFKK
jgi:hypothetical protein